jgi:hypothetical protein
MSLVEIHLFMVLTTSKSQSFGEVRQITRMPNGDLHIDFRNSEVADTVRYKQRPHNLSLTPAV